MRNVRYLNLKESKQKENAKNNVLQEFCERKGKSRKKGAWEKKVEEEIELKESELKETYNAKKTAKSRKKKIELFRKCKEKLFSLIENWKETPGSDEGKTFMKLKE